jgi:hypothetical protein
MGQTNGVVYALAVRSGVLYVGGNFSAVRPSGAAAGTNETPRTGLAAFNTTTGALIGSFDVDLDGEVRALAVSPDGSRLYVGGMFTTVDGVARNRLAAVSTSDGSLDTTFVANASATVTSLATSSSALYVGGDFTTIKSSAQTRLAKLSLTTGTVDTGFTASVDSRVRTIAVPADGSRVLIGGAFDTVNGATQGAVASLDPDTGAVRPWASTGIVPRPANGVCHSTTTGIVTAGSVAYVTAEGDEPGCYEGIYAANISDGSMRWNAECLGASQNIAIVDGWIYKASHQHDCGRMEGGFVGPRNANDFYWYRLTAWHAADGAMGHFHPNTNGVASPGVDGVGPRVLATDGAQLFVGGDFSQVNGADQQGITRFSPTGPNSAPVAPAAAPSAIATKAGTVDIEAPGSWDREDGTLTYRLYRDGGSTPIASIAAESWQWSIPTLRFTDSGLVPGSTHTYVLRANDGTTTSGASPTSNTVTVGATDAPGFAGVVNGSAPTSFWRLADGGTSAADASGNGRTGTLVGGVTTGVAGAAGDQAVSLDGSTGYVTSSAVTAPSAGFTQSVWFKTTTKRGGALLAFSNTQTGAGTNNDRVVFMENDGKLVFAMRSSSSRPTRFSFVRSANTYRDGTWHQVVATYDGATMALYVDGQLAGTATLTTPVDPGVGYQRAGYANLANYYLVFGGNYSGNPAPSSYFFAGSIDEVAVHAAPLSAADVAAQFASGITS